MRGFARQRTHSNTLFLADMLMPTVSDLLICRFSFIPWIWIRIRNGVAAPVALKCSGIAESINERNIFPWYVFFNIIHISVKAFVSRSEVGRRLQDGSVCSRQTFLHALQMIPEQAAGCSLPEKWALALLRCQRRLAKAHVSCHMLCSRNARRSRRRRKAIWWGLHRGEHLRKRALW